MQGRCKPLHCRSEKARRLRLCGLIWRLCARHCKISWLPAIVFVPTDENMLFFHCSLWWGRYHRPPIKNTKRREYGIFFETKRYEDRQAEKWKNVEILTYKKERLGLFGSSLSRKWKEANTTCDHRWQPLRRRPYSGPTCTRVILLGSSSPRGHKDPSIWKSWNKDVVNQRKFWEKLEVMFFM